MIVVVYLQTTGTKVQADSRGGYRAAFNSYRSGSRVEFFFTCYVAGWGAKSP